MSGGALVLVATPIGNLGDLSPRARDALAAADVIACEDTRVTRRLLSASGITGKRLLAVHEHNEAQMVGTILERVARGERVAVVVDAGMPGISDPGERLVRAVSRDGHIVEVVPGPSAAITALAASGLPTGRFTFEGFLPRKGTARTQRIEAIADDERTTIIYESPNRVGATLSDLLAACGPVRRVAVARELTKLHEEVWRGTLGDAVAWIGALGAAPRGEHVIVVGPAPRSARETADAEIEAALLDRVADGQAKRDAIGAVALELGVAKKRVYDIAVRLGNSPRA